MEISICYTSKTLLSKFCEPMDCIQVIYVHLNLTDLQLETITAKSIHKWKVNNTFVITELYREKISIIT